MSPGNFTRDKLGDQVCQISDRVSGSEAVLADWNDFNFRRPDHGTGEATFRHVQIGLPRRPCRE